MTKHFIFYPLKFAWILKFITYVISEFYNSDSLLLAGYVKTQNLYIVQTVNG